MIFAWIWYKETRETQTTLAPTHFSRYSVYLCVYFVWKNCQQFSLLSRFTSSVVFSLVVFPLLFTSQFTIHTISTATDQPTNRSIIIRPTIYTSVLWWWVLLSYSHRRVVLCIFERVEVDFLHLFIYLFCIITYFSSSHIYNNNMNMRDAMVLMMTKINFKYTYVNMSSFRWKNWKIKKLLYQVSPTYHWRVYIHTRRMRNEMIWRSEVKLNEAFLKVNLPKMTEKDYFPIPCDKNNGWMLLGCFECGREWSIFRPDCFIVKLKQFFVELFRKQKKNRQTITEKEV